MRSKSAETADQTRHARAPGQPDRRPRAKVLFVTPELGGYIKSGGLGEVSAALPLAMHALCDVRMLLPGYPIFRQRHQDIAVVRQMPATAALPPWSLGRVTTADGLVLYLVLCDELYDRDGSPYADDQGIEFPDNDIRFARLSLAAAELAAGEADPEWKPDVVHAHDWPAALTAGYLSWRNIDAASIMTIHNLAYQGVFDASRLDTLGIPATAFHVEGAEFHGKISFMKTGIYYASHVTTVSETYAEEITTPAFGCGLDGLLQRRRDRGQLSGILNGIDESWAELSADALTHGNVQHWKQQKADKVRHLFGLNASTGPLFSIVSRLVHQKGIDLSIAVADEIVRQGGQLVVTGRGEPAIEAAVEIMAARHPGAVAARIGFDDEEARAMFAGSDFLLMPSRFEPCGLSQMYAQAAGSLPIAYKTGGLADTIEDGRSGFLFERPSRRSLSRAVHRAIGAFETKPLLGRMRRAALAKRFDWGDSAQRYLTVYSHAAT